MELDGNWTSLDESGSVTLIDVVDEFDDATRRNSWASVADTVGPENVTGCVRMRGGGLLEIGHETCVDGTTAKPMCEYNGKLPFSDP